MVRGRGDACGAGDAGAGDAGADRLSRRSTVSAHEVTSLMNMYRLPEALLSLYWLRELAVLGTESQWKRTRKGRA